MTPSCEIEYQKLQSELNRHWEAARNRKPNLSALNKLLSAFLDEMEKRGADTIPPSASYLFRIADVDNAVYFHSFRNMDGIILVTKGVIVEEVNRHVYGAFGVFSFNDAIKRLFGYVALSGAEAKDNSSVRLRFAILRFSNDFWEIVLRPLYSFITEPWNEYEVSTRDVFYSQYASAFREVLKLWMRQDFSAIYSEQYIALLREMTDTPALKLKTIQACLDSLSVTSEEKV